jgi:hypothetical protein
LARDARPASQRTSPSSRGLMKYPGQPDCTSKNSGKNGSIFRSSGSAGEDVTRWP